MYINNHKIACLCGEECDVLVPFYDVEASCGLPTEQGDIPPEMIRVPGGDFDGLNTYKDGQYWCGEFETDEVDWKLAELIVNIQYACQRHYFGAMAAAYFDNKLKDASVNVQRRQKTYEGFERLPEVFTTDDVIRCFQLKNTSAAYMRISRLQRDHLIEKDEDFVDGGTTKSRYRKTGVLMC